MRFIAKIILGAFMISSLVLSTSTAFAVGKVCDFDSECPGSELCLYNQCVSPIDALLPQPDKESPRAEETKNLSELPNVSEQQVIATIIKNLIGFSMSIAVIGLVIAGIYYLISNGNDEETAKAKNVILYLIIGIAIMAAAYGVIAGITQFKFFQNGFAFPVAEAATIDPDFRPQNEPFDISQEIEREGAAGGAIIILQILASGLLYFAAPLAVIMIGFAGWDMAMGSDDTEKIDTAKKHLTWLLIGLMIIILSFSLTKFVINLLIGTASNF